MRAEIDGLTHNWSLKDEQVELIGEYLSGVFNLADVMRNKRIRWAVSVYGRHLPELREGQRVYCDRRSRKTRKLIRMEDNTRESGEIQIEELDESRV